MAKKKKTPQPAKLGQAQKRDAEKKAAKVKGEKPVKAKPKMESKKVPSDGTMKEHELIAEIRKANQRLGVAEGKDAEAAEARKATKGEVLSAQKALRNLIGDVSDGQQRMNFSKPIEEYHKPLPVVKDTAPQPWKTLPVSELKLGKALSEKFEKAKLFTMGDVAEASKGQWFKQNIKFTDRQWDMFTDACTQFYNQHPEAIDNSSDNGPKTDLPDSPVEPGEDDADIPLDDEAKEDAA